MQHELITIEEAARYLKVTPYTIRRYLREKKLPGIKLGGQWRIRSDALEKKLLAASEGGESAKATADDFFTHKTLDQLIAEQGTEPVADIAALSGDFWPQEESTEEFLAQLYAWRTELMPTPRFA